MLFIVFILSKSRENNPIYVFQSLRNCESDIIKMYLCEIIYFIPAVIKNKYCLDTFRILYNVFCLESRYCGCKNDKATKENIKYLKKYFSKP